MPLLTRGGALPHPPPDVSLDRPDTLLTSEMFGPTFQGEGPSTGRLAVFLRLGACNLSCAWCDTPYTWDWTGKNGRQFDPRKETTRHTIDHVVSVVIGLIGTTGQQPIIVVTGGEPLLQQPALVRFIEALDNRLAWGPEVEIETNGTIPPGEELVDLVARFNVSPKLSHSGDTAAKRLRPAALTWFAADATPPLSGSIFKFVVRPDHVPQDVAEVDHLVRTYGIPSHAVWLMPCGTSAHTIEDGLHTIGPLALARGYNLSGRLHVTLWGDQRGR